MNGVTAPNTIGNVTDSASDDNFALPLLIRTPDSWASVALSDPLALLNDHAHLEKKAATNALDLLQRWPQGECPTEWINAITAIARDEAQHLALVTRLMKQRGGQMSRLHQVQYAKDLHREVRYGRANQELLDRLLISSLIEARSCERFEILSRCAGDPQLVKLYKNLWASERGHYQLFLELAKSIAEGPEITARWQELLEAEARIIVAQPVGATMHGWVS